MLSRGLPAAPPPGTSPRAGASAITEVPGWAGDDHAAALDAYRGTFDLLDGWPVPPSSPGDARAFFEDAFEPRVAGGGPGGAPGLLTGYHEPELPGSLAPTPRFRVPLHALPPEGLRGLARAEVMAGALDGHEVAWVEDPLDAFLLQVQGSGRIRLSDGGLLRLGFAGRNGRPYASIGRALVARGAVPAGAMSIDAIRAWALAHPEGLPALLALNASYVFLRPLPGLPPDRGPLGAMGRPVSPGRSLAVDPAHVPLGAPVWVEAGLIRRLAVAQDTGSAIRGPHRGDLFIGTGAAAGVEAGRLREPARLAVLWPRRGAS